MNETKWLTVKQASQYCFEMHLPRSTKSLRRWCAKEEIEAQKRKIANTEKWFIDRASLKIKIQEELEFLKHSERPLSKTPPIAARDTDMSGHEQTQADISGNERLQADTPGRERAQQDRQTEPQVRNLEDQVLLLKRDVEWRDQLLKDQKNTNIILMDEIKGQSRYIGHIETHLARIGQTPDQAFLAAPVPKSNLSEDTRLDPQIVSPEIN